MPVNSQGLIDVDQLVSEIRPHTALVSVMAINNETGELCCCCWALCACHGVIREWSGDCLASGPSACQRWLFPR